jgi:hypothetical protein
VRQAHAHDAVQHGHQHAKARHEDPHLAESLDLARRGDAHFQQEQHQHASEQALVEGRDLLPLLVGGDVADGHAADQQQDAAAADHAHEQFAGVDARVALAAHRHPGEHQRVDDAELHQRHHRGHVAFRGRAHRGGKAHGSEEGGGGDRAVVGGDGGRIADVHAPQAPGDDVGQRGNGEGHEQRDGQQRPKSSHVGLGKLASTRQAQREKQVDGQQLHHGLGEFELALDGARERAQQKGQHDGLKQVGQQQVHTGHQGSSVRAGVGPPGSKPPRIQGERWLSFLWSMALKSNSSFDTNDLIKVKLWAWLN